MSFFEPVHTSLCMLSMVFLALALTIQGGTRTLQVKQDQKTRPSMEEELPEEQAIVRKDSAFLSLHAVHCVSSCQAHLQFWVFLCLELVHTPSMLVFQAVRHTSLFGVFVFRAGSHLTLHPVLGVSSSQAHLPFGCFWC